ASFGVCIEPACPRATPKTLAGAAPAAIPAAAPAQILPAPTARPVSMIEQPPPIAPMKKTVKTPQPQEPEQIRQLVVGFGFGSAELSAAARATLDSSVQDARRADRIVISGRTDVVGDVKVNQALATSRALAVRDHLRTVAPDLAATISIDAQGRCCFVASNADETGRARNRRVEVVFLAAGGA
ncbi:MAG: OmpA family protein, partial [Burkholderiaceae bacterium]|nr:OmpA family protein [Burkholderiaceae bacterium]